MDTHQCPFGTGNGYGDGRAISVFEGVFKGQRWEMQIKGGGPTPYCRGADGRAVLRSSVREFLAQEYMHALGVPTTRSLTLYVSKSESVARPWYAQESYSKDRAGINAVTDQIRGGLQHFLPRIIPCTREYFSLEKKLL
ncbi:protein adenylyltransferase SelO family protein [uncultured Desulfobacter sp.]|uniref:protein adenylyltransferase SelO family protein n=1 Tax=uncultured Desulfobacter sp. TaxID=240139 RepID=UPI0029F59F63|nr:protein adenylyltransferase SelO family protein [uncultured Desulfobacter sp.]